MLRVVSTRTDIFSYRHYFFSLYYFVIFCLFLYYAKINTESQRKLVIIFPSNFNNTLIENSFKLKYSNSFYLHEPMKNFSSAQYYSTFFDNLFSCELNKIAMNNLWNFSSTSLDATKFIKIKSFIPKSHEVITSLKHACIHSKDIVVSFTDKWMSKFILDYHLLSEVGSKHDLNLVLIVQPPSVGDGSDEKWRDSETYCQTAMDRIEKCKQNSTKTFFFLTLIFRFSFFYLLGRGCVIMIRLSRSVFGISRLLRSFPDFAD